MNGTWTESISQILGWCYFVLWSLSFYPQVPQNHRRRSTDGFSIDFALLNVLGLSAYTVFSACFLFSPVVHAQYAQRHPQSPEPTVQWNDFVYALHGALICCWTSSHFLCARFWNFNSKQQRVSTLALVLFWGCLGVVPLTALWIMVSISWEWIDVVRGKYAPRNYSLSWTQHTLTELLLKGVCGRHDQGVPHGRQIHTPGSDEL